MAAKKKALPDHRSPGWTPSYYRPTSEDASSLADKYAFKSDFPLRDRLEDVYSSEEMARYLADHDFRISEQKELLREVCKRSDAMEEIIRKLGVKELKLLAKVELSLSDLKEFKKDTHKVFMASLCALKRIENKKSKKSRNEPVWKFVWHLADVWAEGTQTEPTAGYDDMGERYIGDFYSFVLQCADLGNIELSQGDPGGTIVNILKKWRQRK